MNVAAADLEIRGVLLPLHTGQLLLPNVTVSEVVGYREPDEPPDGAPEWLLGTFPWRQRRIPLVSYDALLGASGQEVGQRARIALCNTLNGDPRHPFIGILLRSIPRLMRVTEDLIESCDDPGPPDAMVSQHVKVGGQEAWIPDLDILEKSLAEFLD